MNGYLFHFLVYIMAMTGIIFLAVFTYKMTYSSAKMGLKSSTLSVTDSMKLTPKKTLYVVKAGDEKFLIASDFDSTTLISKLEADETVEEKVTQIQTKRQDNSSKLSSFDGLKSMNDFVSKFETQKTGKKQVFKELARKLQAI